MMDKRFAFGLVCGFLLACALFLVIDFLTPVEEPEIFQFDVCKNDICEAKENPINCAHDCKINYQTISQYLPRINWSK